MSQEKRSTKKGFGVGSPQNVSHLMVDNSEVSSPPADDKRGWFRKYQSKKPPTAARKEEPVSDKQKAQVAMALTCVSHQDPGLEKSFSSSSFHLISSPPLPPIQ